MSQPDLGAAPPPALAAQTVALLLADSRLPSGGHVNSAGLEPALLAGMPLSQVPLFLRARARTVSLVDAATAVVVRGQLMRLGGHGAAGGTELRTQLRMIERQWAARTPSQAARSIARELGRGLLRLTRSLWPESPGLEMLRDLGGPQAGDARDARARPLVMGAVAAHTGLDAASLMRLSIYDDVASAAAALLKLEPGDPVAAMALVLEACRAAEPDVAALAHITQAEEIPAPSAPQTEEWTERHTLTTRRLFRA